MTPAFDTFRHLPAWPDDGSPNPYMIGFEGLPPEYIAKSVVRSLQSTMPCHNKAFPTIPEFAADARNLIGADYQRKRRDIEGINAIESRPAEITPEQAERRKTFTAAQLKRMPNHDAKLPEQTKEEALRDLRELAMRPKTMIPISDSLAKLLKQQSAERSIGETE